MIRFADLMKRPATRAVLILLLVGWVCWLRGPSLTVPMWNVDETIHATVAEVLLDGGTLYRDAIDQRTPLTYFVTTAVFAVTGSSLTALALGRIAFRISHFAFRISHEWSIHRIWGCAGFCGILEVPTFTPRYPSRSHGMVRGLLHDGCGMVFPYRINPDPNHQTVLRYGRILGHGETGFRGQRAPSRNGRQQVSIDTLSEGRGLPASASIGLVKNEG